MSKNQSIITAAMTAALCVAALSSGAYSADMRDITTMALVKDMGLGINLGNTFDSEGSSESNYETAWGSPKITKAMIDGYASAGFKTVRIPVRWTNLMTGNNNGGTYTISTVLLDRVEEVVNWVLEDGMYAIVNIHHQNWIKERFPADSAECMRKYTRIWEQVSAKFKDKSDYLILESMNEEGVWLDVWTDMYQNGTTGKARAYGLLNAINQKFVDIVRASGGNNGDRHLLIAGYDTNIDRTSDQMFKLPTDPKSRCAVSVHYYDPFGFTHLEHDENWATMLTTWGTAADRDELRRNMDKLKTNFVNKGIPVIVGEYGFASKVDRGAEEIRKYTLAVADAIYTRDMCPVLWDIQWNPSIGERIYYYDRKSNPPAFSDPQFVAGIQELGGHSTKICDMTGASKARPKSTPTLTITGKTLNVNAPPETKVQIRMVNLTGKTVAAFKSTGGASFSLRKIPTGAYLVETIKDGRKAMSAITLR
ncbi:MAG: cellulase family glycosylhydrolase [Chitinispirillales bacterium]|jgi:endoglucanase|nr:cellulase family glycosylhydrolase [Chitinispirillales bacterium]